MAEFFQKSGRVCVDGSEVLRWRVSLPLCDEAIAAFYEEIGMRVVGYCEGELSDLVTQEFDRSEDPDKRFAFSPFSYRLEGRVTYEDGQFLSILLAAELRRRGERAPLRQFEEGQVWERTEGVRLPPEEVVRLFCQTPLLRKERKNAKGILLSENHVLWYDGKEWNKKEIFLKDRIE